MKKNQKSLRKVVASSATRRTRRQTLRSALPELLESRTLMSTYLVTNTGDSGLGSLRAAITSVDGDSSADTIHFQIPGSGVQTIYLNSALPAITNTVTIDGTSQTNYAGTPLIELNGSNLTASGPGLDFEGNSAGSVVEGLTIDHFTLSAGVLLNSGGVTLENNYIGTDPSGSFVGLNANGYFDNANYDGVDIYSNGNTLTDNLISGNNYSGVWVSGNGNTLTGNFIGTDATGEVAIPNSLKGSNVESGGVVVDNATNTTIGGPNAADRNVISGNDQDGVVFSNDSGSGNLVEGNDIGLDASGQNALIFSGGQNYYAGNNGDGVDLGTFHELAVSNVLVENNLISGNQGDGVYMSGASNNTVIGNLIGLGSDGVEQTDSSGNLLGNEGDGVTIDVDSSGNTIGGLTAADRNVIGGSAGNEISVHATGAVTANVIEGNYIGTDSSGYVADPSTDDIYITGGLTLVGGTATGAGNVISGAYGYGVDLEGGNSAVYGNMIGTGPDGATAVPNDGDGVHIHGSSNNIIGGAATGEGNIIAFNGQNGVNVLAGANPNDTVKNDIEGNSIYGNALIGIDLGGDGVTANDSEGHSGPNMFQDFPTLNSLSATSTTVTVSGMLQDAAVGSPYTIDLYNNVTADPSNHGQGQTFVGAELVTIGTGGSFTANFTVSQVPSGTVWSATATDQSGNTSEFSVDYISSLVVQKQDAQVQLSSSLNPAAFGQSVTFTATVTGSGAQPTGLVTFYDGANNLGTFTLSGGTASFTTSSLSVASHSISITYAGDGNYNQGSAGLLENITTAPTTTVLSVNPTSSLYGQTVTLTATVTPTINGVMPTGTVNFFDGTSLLGSGTLSNGVATFTTYTLAIGPHALNAQYIGDTNFAGSTSNTVNETVSPLASNISGTVYNDLTGNGLTNDDTPLANVTVDLFQLVNGSYVLANSLVTGSNGQYSFNTSSGTYSVQEVVPANTTETVGAAGYTLNATSGTLVTGAYFDNFKNMSVSGTVYNDLAGHGNLAGAAGEQGVTVQLLSGSNVVASTTTASDGSYSFNGILPGTYTVSEVVPSGWTQTFGASGYSVASISGQMATGDNFANFQNVTLGGTVYTDVTGNGGTLTPLAGVTVQLLSGSNVLQSAASGANGAYAFSNLGPGSYTVQEVVPTGAIETIGSAGYSASAQSGQNVANDNFANFQKISISGTMYQDVTGNGFSSDDTAFGGGTVNLFLNGATTPLATTSTASNGTYTFANLGPGTYSVQEVVPAGWTQTGGSTGYTVPATSGLASSGNNFDNFQNFAISGTVYNDLTGNGITSDDTSLSGVTVQLMKGSTLVASATSSSSGTYSFANLGPGSYTVSELVPAGWTQTVGVGGYSVSGQSGHNVTDNFAQFQNVTISGVAYTDLTGNGFSSDDTPLSGVTVNLFKNGGTAPAATATTASNGTYSFSNLGPGSYSVQEVAPSGYTITGGAAGYTLTATSGQNAANDNFDNYLPPSGTISGYVFCDDNLDGVFDETAQDGNVDPESGEGLATVTLTGTTTSGVGVSLTTTTASNGYYSFSGLAAGTYTVSLTGYSPNHQAEQSHANVKISESTTETLTAGQTLSGAAMGVATKNNGLDFPEIAPGGLQGFVWDDANNDGNIDYNEAGIVNVTITLNGVTYTGAKVTQSTVTDNNGEYVFANLLPGTYTLTESTPSGFTDGKDMVGSLGGSETYSSNCGSSSGCSTGSTNCGSNCGNSSCGQTNCGSNCTNSSCGSYCYNDCYGNYGYNCFTNYSTNCYNNNCGSNNCGNCGGNSNNCNSQYNCGWSSGCNNAQNTFSNVQIGGCEDVGVGYNFGETGGKLSGCTTDTASLAFWHNSYGQALLCSLNGGPNSTALGNWLATMFPSMYGAQAKVNFAGMTNSQIAAFYNSNDFNVTGIKLDAAVLSAALSSYVTNTTWAGGSYATKYGFTVSAQGVGYDTINVGSDGVAFGVSNNSSITILQALDATDQQAVDGTLYNGNATLRSDAYAIYAAIAQSGLST